jgi:hypothetical protein
VGTALLRESQDFRGYALEGVVQIGCGLSEDAQAAFRAEL